MAANVAHLHAIQVRVVLGVGEDAPLEDLHRDRPLHAADREVGREGLRDRQADRREADEVAEIRERSDDVVLRRRVITGQGENAAPRFRVREDEVVVLVE